MSLLRLVILFLLASSAVSGVAASGEDGRAMIRMLAAKGPNARLGANAEVFDWLTGSWDLKCDFISESGERTPSLGDWYFGWIVNGYMVQDMISFYPPADLRNRYSGTSLRMYDTSRKEWLVV